MEWLKRRAAALLSSLSKTASGPHCTGLLVNANGVDLLVSPSDMYVGRHLRFNGEYGRLELERILGLIRPDSRCLIVGGHVGSIALPIAQCCAHVSIIEANPDNFSLLARNAQLNGIENVDLHNIAAAESGGEIQFLMSTVNSGGSKRAPLVSHNSYTYDNPRSIKVPSHRLDDYLAGQSFDLILIDIEGSEYFALQGMSRLLGSARALIVEFVPHHLRNVAQCSVADFVNQIAPHFDQLQIPSIGDARYSADDFEPQLSRLFNAGKGDDGIVFVKAHSEGRLPAPSFYRAVLGS